MKPLAPGFRVREKFAVEGGLEKTVAYERHGGPVGFEEEEGAVSAVRLIREVKSEELVGDHPEVGALHALADPHPPPHRVPPLSRFLGRLGEDLCGRDQTHAPMRAASDFEAHHDVGDEKGMAQEEARHALVLRRPVGPCARDFVPEHEKVSSAIPERIDHRLVASLVVFELYPRPVQIAVVVKEIQATEDLLWTRREKRNEVSRAEEAVLADGADDLKIARGEPYSRGRHPLKTRLTSVVFNHVEPATPGMILSLPAVAA
jgi:hypothetical protein